MGKFFGYLFGGCLGTIIWMVLWCSIFGWLFSMVWNWLIPDLFNGPEITVLQAMGLMFLFSIAFPKVSVTNNNNNSK